MYIKSFRFRIYNKKILFKQFQIFSNILSLFRNFQFAANFCIHNFFIKQNSITTRLIKSSETVK